MKSISESIEINAAPSAVFALVTDLPNMGKYSPENTGGKWLDGATNAALGAKFRGSNTQGTKNWTTLSGVTTFSPDTNFVFRVTSFGMPVATWSYQLEATATGTKVTETWDDNRFGIMKFFSGLILKDREGFTRTSIHQTLSLMKEHLEARG
jgi:Polyketide cyclase / dehydrase and lipid transport